MLLQAAVVALALFGASVSAQTNATSIDPNSVTPQLRGTWCNGQNNVCTVLCDQNVNVNNCFPDNLTYSCLCTSNNSTPDVADYTTSLPAFICQESYGLCITANKDDREGQANCTTNIENKCGKLNIADYTPPASTSSVASASATPSKSGSGTGTATAATTSATKSSAAVAAMAIGREYGTSIIAAGLVAAFGFLA